jgi:hypothetical protein
VSRHSINNTSGGKEQAEDCDRAASDRACEPVTAALLSAQRGWRVFPCRGKTPLTHHGFKDATTDPEAIEVWWRKFPTATIGIGRNTLAQLERQKAASSNFPPYQQFAFSMGEFCAAHRISTDYYLKLQRKGLGPVIMKVGGRTLISVEAAADWRRAREVPLKTVTEIARRGGEPATDGPEPLARKRGPSSRPRCKEAPRYEASTIHFSKRQAFRSRPVLAASPSLRRLARNVAARAERPGR